VVDEAAITSVADKALLGVDIPNLGEKSQGKVRDIYFKDKDIYLITTDRLSAFDRVLGAVPYKGQVLLVKTSLVTMSKAHLTQV